MKHRIHVVEDDAKLGQQVVDTLRGAGYEVRWTSDGDSARLQDAREDALWILDLMLPGTYGLDVLKELRTRSDVPVLVLSAKTDTQVKVRAFELGADDYLSKPFWPEELLARVSARLRRPVLAREGSIDLGPLVIDAAGRTLRLENVVVDLTRVEFEILLALARRRGAAVTREWLAEHVLDPDREGTERTLDVHVSRLRKKLRDQSAWITTVWGVGYRLEEPRA